MCQFGVPRYPVSATEPMLQPVDPDLKSQRWRLQSLVSSLRFGFLDFLDFLCKDGDRMNRRVRRQRRADVVTHVVEDVLQLLVGLLQVVVDDDHVKHPRLFTCTRDVGHLLRMRL